HSGRRWGMRSSCARRWRQSAARGLRTSRSWCSPRSPIYLRSPISESTRQKAGSAQSRPSPTAPPSRRTRGGCWPRTETRPSGRPARRLEGRRIASARIDDSRLTRPEDPAWIAARLTDECVEAVERRGKYLLIRLESGDVLVVHLRMTGSFRYTPASHERAVLE